MSLHSILKLYHRQNNVCKCPEPQCVGTAKYHTKLDKELACTLNYYHSSKITISMSLLTNVKHTKKYLECVV